MPFSVPSLLFSCQVVSDSLRPHGLQHTRLPRPSLSPRACSNSCPSSRWCHPTISSSASHFPPALNLSQHQGLFQWVFASGGQSIGASASASVLPMNIQDWFPLGWTRLISLQPKGLSRIFSSTIWKDQLLGIFSCPFEMHANLFFKNYLFGSDGINFNVLLHL